MPIINFNKKIYNITAIQNAIQAFQEVTPITFSEGNIYIKVIFPEKNNNNQEVIADEFSNYVLALIKTNA